MKQRHLVRAILIIIAILLLTFFVIDSRIYISDSQKEKTMAEVRKKTTAEVRVLVTLEVAASWWHRHEQLPSNPGTLTQAVLALKPTRDSIDDWFDPKSQAVVDPWGVPLLVEQNSDGFAIISAGPDKRFHTSDDIKRPIKFSKIY